MKHRLRYGLAGLALSMTSLLLTVPAKAANYSGTCANINTFDGNGNVDIADGACTLPNVTASGYIHINVSSLTSGDLTAGADVNVASSGTVATGDINAPSNVTISAASTVATGALSGIAGNISVNSTGALTTDALNSGGTISLTSVGGSGSTTVNGTSTSFGKTTINAGTTITLTDTVTALNNGDLTLTSNGAISTQAISDDGIFSVNARGSGGSVDVNGTIGSTGSVQIQAGSTITITDDTLIDETGDIFLSAQGDINTKLLSATDEVSLQSVNSGDITVDGQINVTDGQVQIFSDGKITITDTVQTFADGNIKLSASDDIETKSLISSQVVDVQNDTGSGADVNIGGDVTASDGYVFVKSDGLINITGTTNSFTGGHIFMVAQETLATGSINGAPGFNIDLKANQNGDTSDFVTGVGGANGTNGIVTAYGGAVYITNSTPGHAGNITISNSGDVANNLSSGPSYIILNAQNGVLHLAGSLNIDGDGTNPAGQIVLLANTINFDDGVGLYSNEPLTTGSLHGVSLAASTVNYGSSNGLYLNADGTGNAPGAGFVYLLAQGATTVTETGDQSSLFISATSAPIAGPITYNGNGPLYATANGNDEAVVVGGSVITFSGGALTFQSNGNQDNYVSLLNQSFTGTNSLTINSSGNVLLNASGGDNSNGGHVFFNVDAAEINANAFNVHADGPSTGDGDGGTVNVSSTNLVLNSATTATITANAATAGTGNGSPNAISFTPGPQDFTIGTDPGQYSFYARGGTTDGDAGTISIAGDQSSVTVNGEFDFPIDVTAPGSTGNGGTMLITANGLTFTGNYVTLSADSGTTAGNGGIIKIITAVTPVAIGTESDGEITLTADSNGEGNGGTILVSSPAGITADSASISVVAMGSGTGGTISLDAGNSDLSLSGIFDVSGGTGDDDDDESGGSGGSISLSGANIALPDGINSLLFADGNGTGKGGDISLTTTTGDITVGTGAGNFLFEAKSNDSGDGGTVTVNSAGSVTVDGNFVDVSAGGDGGNISITASSNILITNMLNASGGCEGGNGGSVTLNASTAAVGDINADAGYTSCVVTAAKAGTAAKSLIPRSDVGGAISITVGTNLTETGLVSARGIGDGNGGTIELNQIGSSNDGITLTGATITAAGDIFGTGNGGQLTVNAAGSLNSNDAYLGVSGSPAGSGGQMHITVNQFMLSGSASSLLADGGAGNPSNNGSGGSIEIQVGGVVENSIILADDTIIVSAIGVGDGQGGSVIINHAKAPDPVLPDIESHIHVNTLINVSGSGSGASVNDGSITINAVSCRQYTYSAVTWPLAYWDCTLGNSAVIPTVPVAAAALLTETDVRQYLANNNTYLYAMTDVAAWNSFFATTPAQTTPLTHGVTIIDGTFVASAIFVKNPDGSPAPYPAETTVHELGHAFDAAKGSPSLNDEDWADARIFDFSQLGLMNQANCLDVYSSINSVCTTYAGHTNTYIFEQIYFGGEEPSSDELFGLIFEHVELNARTTPGLEQALAYFSEMNAYMYGETGINP